MKTILLLLVVLAVTVNSWSLKKFLRRSEDESDASDLAELERKWRVMCNMFDIDRDESIGPNDLNTTITNFLLVNNISESASGSVRNQFRSVWKIYVIARPNADTVTCQKYVQVRRDLYTSNRAKFNTNVEHAMSAFRSFMDVDNNGVLGRGEIDNFSSVFNINPRPHWDVILEHYGASGIPVALVSKNIILFMEKPEEDEFQKLFEGGIVEDRN